MPDRTPSSGKNRGTMLHKMYSGVASGAPVNKMKRMETRPRKALSGQPLYGKNRPGTHPLRGG